MLRGVRSLLSDTGFLVALVIAAVGTLVVVGAPRWSSARWSKWHVGFGYVVLVAALVAMRVDLQLEWRLVVGLGLLVVAGSARPHGPGATVRIVALVAGAALVAASMPNATGWMRLLGFVAVMAAVPTSGVIDRRGARLVPVLLLVAAIGIYVCAPDTEYAKVLLGALVPVSLLLFDPALRAAAPTGAVSALVVWIAVVEGRGRPGAECTCNGKSAQNGPGSGEPRRRGKRTAPGRQG